MGVFDLKQHITFYKLREIEISGYLGKEINPQEKYMYLKLVPKWSACVNVLGDSPPH